MANELTVSYQYTKQDIINGMSGMINAKALGEEYLVYSREEAK